MISKFLHQNNDNDKIILFFNGWGCTESVVKHLFSQSYDVLMLYQYHIGDKKIDLKKYKEINVVAWSMGVWVASDADFLSSLKVDNAIAINGTQEPVSDNFGIPEQIFEGTLNNLCPQTLEKFAKRSCGNKQNFDAINVEPFRDFQNINDELKWWKNSYKAKNSKMWNKAIISQNDRIIPLENQMKFWEKKNIEVKIIQANHYAFEKFESWEQILNY